ncbi:MAG: molybdate ABC transporter substrate-binding protein [Epsilonproteobacteria bacterium]|nr:molybdate ABC transporter substrate-binding protein [Campylobacterota bacterium]
MRIIVLIFLFLTLLSAQEELLFYCGTTMAKAMREIAQLMEHKYNIKIQIIQGGSGDLYNSLSMSKVGDLYLPGSDSYIKKHQKDGLFGYSRYVGYNQIAIVVAKHNPKHIKGLDDLVREDLNVALGNPNTCSIGRASIKVLKRYKGDKFVQQVKNNIIIFVNDSRDMNQKIKTHEIDMGLNWKATAYFPQNKPYIDVVAIDEKYAPKKKLLLTMLTFSTHKDLARKFIDLVASKKGKEIMKKYGFLDE